MEPSGTKLNTTGYRLAKRYGITSLAAMAATLVVIFFFIRFEALSIIEDASKRSNETLTIATEYALNDHFVMFLNVVKNNKDREISHMPFEPVLERVIRKMLSDTHVVRIKLYNLSGKVVYTTDPSYIEDDEEHNEAFSSAISGIPATSTVYESTIKLFRPTKENSLVQTYVPIRATEKSPVLGVMEIYSDISGYIVEANKTTFLLLIVILLLMAFLYFFLLLHIKRSERIIERQNRETREKKKLLEFLTSKMITAQEDEKKRIAFELHEDVVQTLSGVKMQLERYILSIGELDEDDNATELSKNIIPVLQEAAHRIRSVAIDLRPPSLDDFGLKAALNSLVSECHTITTGLQISIDIAVDEDQIYRDQKSILYRMFKDTLKMICLDEHLDGEVNFTMEKVENHLVLRAEIDSNMIEPKYQNKLPGFFISLQEKTILSGGEFYILAMEKDHLVVQSVWSS
ncbi:MAG: histidine kinase [Candidatus Thiodiazotropha sp. 6PLUC2]